MFEIYLNKSYQTSDKNVQYLTFEKIQAKISAIKCEFLTLIIYV